MDGKAGNDKLEGMSGADTILGANGDDLLYGGRADGNSVGGRDEVRGQDGNDTIFGGSGADDLYGGMGNDTIYDALEDDSSVDRIYGGDDDDEIIVVNFPASKDEIASCGSGSDVVHVDNLDVVASDCEVVRDAFADVFFSSPVPVEEALQIAEQTDSWVMTLEDDYMVGGESMHDFYIGPSDADATAIEQAYEQERLAFYQDMVNEHDDPDLTPEERAEEQPQITAMEEALASNDAGQAEVTGMTLNGSEQEFQNLASGGVSAAPSDASAASADNIERIEIVDMSTNDERIEQQEAFEAQATSSSETLDTEVTTASSDAWYPVRGRSKVASSSIAGKRYVSQRFTWNNPPPGGTAGACCGYEHDFKTQNGNGCHYLTGAQTPSYRGCFPRNTYASTSYPAGSYAYLESNLTSRGTCERKQLTYTIGIANTARIVAGKRYFTFIRTPNGNTRSDKGRLFAELLYRAPEDCFSVYCVYKARDIRHLIDPSTDFPWFRIPSK
ncbi:MAG: calcium-binding protein [Rubrobacteraceae bacterium]